MKVLIAVGGGGHFSPALAVIERMPKEWDVLLVGRKYAFEGDEALSFEYQTAKRLGLPFQTITTGRLQRKLSKHTVLSLAKMPVGMTQAFKILRIFSPDVVLSFGGYISVPIVLAAAVQRLPIVIHEQTLHAGLANKIAAKFATTICISWQESKKFFPRSRTVLTGNPLRRVFFSYSSSKGDSPHREVLDSARTIKNQPLIYVTGGSGGAHGINVLVEGCLGKLLEKYTIIHQTGDAKTFGDYRRLEKKREELPDPLRKKYIVKKFIEPEKVMQVLTSADLVVARSGINSVTELLYLGKPCLFIPLPYGQQNEQLTNAEFVRKIGLAEVIDQLATTPEEFFEKICAMVSQLDVYASHKKEAHELIHTDAAEKIIEEVQKCL